jgi:outer membrane lipoprotein-sorting protein
MMRLAISLLIFFCLPALANDSLLGSLSGKARNIESFSGTFVQYRKIVVLPLPLNSEGKFSYHHQTGMVWTTLHPVQSTVIISDQGIQTEDAESVRRTVGSPQVAKALLGVFSGRLESLSEQFNIVASGSISDWRLQLKPKNDLLAAEITSIDIRGKETTESVSIADANGDSSNLTFKTHSIKFFEK